MRIQAAPFHIKDAQLQGTKLVQPIERISKQINISDYDERWLQELVHSNPELIPASTIEPAFNSLIPVCMELPCPSGYLDNLFVTPDGYLLLVECKLWRNPESRRKVIAQVMDYAKDFASWSYEDLNSAIRHKTKSKADNPLFDIVCEDPSATDEIIFVDRVSRNLSLGRHLLLIVGDGIQENMVSLANHVQQHMGLHFTLGLVEISMYQFPEDDGILVIPNVIVKTTNIERAVVRIEGGQAQIEQPVTAKSVQKSSRAKSLSEVEFFERLAESRPERAIWLKNLLEKLDELGVTYEIRRTLVMRYSPDGDREFGLGYVETNGVFKLGHVCWELDKIGKRNLADEFLKSVAGIVDGASLKSYDNKEKELSVQVDGRTLSIDDLIGKEEEYYAAIKRHVDKIRQFTSDY